MWYEKCRVFSILSSETILPPPFFPSRRILAEDVFTAAETVHEEDQVVSTDVIVYLHQAPENDASFLTANDHGSIYQTRYQECPSKVETQRKVFLIDAFAFSLSLGKQQQ